ncbi:methionine ABC transporter permease [uncultured Kluyvera sp.]|uniref:methionine ABC transporter permease n=1 Tax=uncultured Kluyvera sp. TaxID=286549 RepID=UPI0028064FFD|nr:methionine ABC transporter permease [uncultured Kluyvera sp.]
MLAFLAGIDWNDVAQAGLDTLIMLGWALGFTVLIGLPLGVILYLTGQPRLLYRVLSLLVNIMRSLPFIILLIVMIPLTTLITGTSLGVQGTIPPLVAGCAPFFARLVETSLREVDHGLIEANWAMGGDTWQLIWHTLLPESRGGLIAALTVTSIVLVDYTSMAGVIGGGGLGDLAIRFGYQRFQTDVMAVTVVLLIALVQVLQMSGDRLVRRMSRK